MIAIPVALRFQRIQSAIIQLMMKTIGHIGSWSQKVPPIIPTWRLHMIGFRQLYLILLAQLTCLFSLNSSISPIPPQLINTSIPQIPIQMIGSHQVKLISLKENSLITQKKLNGYDTQIHTQVPICHHRLEGDFNLNVVVTNHNSNFSCEASSATSNESISLPLSVGLSDF